MEKSSRSLTLSIYMGSVKLQQFQWLSVSSNCTSLPLQRHWNTNACAKSSYVFSAFVDRHHGTPMLLEGVRCIGVELEYDSEQSDWQGFDWFNVTLVFKVRSTLKAKLTKQIRPVKMRGPTKDFVPWCYRSWRCQGIITPQPSWVCFDLYYTWLPTRG